MIQNNYYSHKVRQSRLPQSQFNKSLNANILNSQEYSFKIFLIPKLGNHRNSTDPAIEFKKFDPNTPKEMNKNDKMVVAVKEKTIQVANQGKYKPKQVINILKEKQESKKI